MKNKRSDLLSIISLLSFCLWSLTIFIRETSIMENKVASFLFGIAPNLSVGVILPSLILRYYSTILKKEITRKNFFILVIIVYILLFISELLHQLFLNSKIDPYDMAASFVSLGIMVILAKYKKYYKN